jgi:hypothetical protein
MSVWTHLSGIIRYDIFTGVDENVKDKLPDFGNEAHWDDNEATWNKCTVPCGSEGSISIDVVGAIASISGDLRNFYESDHHEIIEYFARITKKSEAYSVRQGVFTIMCQCQIRTFVYMWDSKSWIEMEELTEGDPIL